MEYFGETASLLVAVFWTVTALSFEYASVRVGSLAVNFIRLLFGLAFLSLYTWISRGMILPLDASADNWIWLSISGVIGFVLGDLFLFKSYTIIGARFSMLIMTLVPPVTALIGWFMLGEVLTFIELTGMLLTFAGIALAVFSRKKKKGFEEVKYPIKGILYALGGVIGQAVGLVFSKYGMGEYDAFAATQIRIIVGIVGFGVIVILFKRTGRITQAFKSRQGLWGIVIGSFFGPFLGVSFSLLAVKYTETGVASTLMAMVPIFIILPSVFIFKQKITLGEILGAFISVGGVILFFT